MEIKIRRSEYTLEIEGMPKLVIVEVSGRLIPYPSNRTILQLCNDFEKLGGGLSELKAQEPPLSREPTRDPPPRSSSIEKGDIVRCIKLLPRDDGEPQELIEGREYTVLNPVKHGGQVVAYEIVDGSIPVPIRMAILASQVELVSKAPATGPKLEKFEIIRKCEKCEKDLCMILGEGWYIGHCKCGHKQEEQRNESAA